MPDKKYRMGTLASEEHRYPTKGECDKAAKNFYLFNGDNPGPIGPEPSPIELPKPLGEPQTTTTVYSWRSPGTDVEMRFIVIDGLQSPEIIHYYRVEGRTGTIDEDDLKEAMQPSELGEAVNAMSGIETEIKKDNSLVNNKYVWRAIFKKKSGDNRLYKLTTGFIINPPYP